MLLPLDILVLLKIVARRDAPWTQPELANELSISQSMVSRALKSAEQVGLYRPATKCVNTKALEEALIHGARYFLGTKQGGDTRGMPTAWAAPPLSEKISSSEPMPPVWPDPYGTSRGLMVEPLHPNVPKAAKRDQQLYELLALLDAIRIGGPREAALAATALRERLNTK